MQCNNIGCVITRIKDLIRQSLWASGAGGVVIGISGGIDSAVVAGLAAKAIGPEKVIGVSMPSSTNNPQDLTDAEELCQKYGIILLTIPVADIVDAAFSHPELQSGPIMRGNFTARIRMAILYNIAASKGYLVCGTSNKTEYLLGYSTKWGDGAADIQPILHLLKKDVYAIARDLEIPEAILTKTPSAGFWDGQSDEAELGLTYDEVDEALLNLENQEYKPTNSVQESVLELIKKSQHKRIRATNLLY